MNLERIRDARIPTFCIMKPTGGRFTVQRIHNYPIQPSPRKRQEFAVVLEPIILLLRYKRKLVQIHTKLIHRKPLS
jgi:hypothetical protein